MAHVLSALRDEGSAFAYQVDKIGLLLALLLSQNCLLLLLLLLVVSVPTLLQTDVILY
jgi:hypothetical protein